MNKLDKAKEIIKEHYNEASLGIFNCRNDSGDPMITIYNEDGVMIDICYYYSYFEVFGLTDKEFEELENYYEALKKEK